jgi:sugar-specific transcriptional regulator TrmB
MFDEKKEKEILENLKSLGLKDKEASVYLALLKLGEVGSSKIIKETDLHGQYVYMSLESLEEKGLVQHVIKKGRKKFTAKNPNILIKLIERQKALADKVTNQLKEIVNLPTQQQFETYQGKESFISHEFELLEKSPEKSELLIIGGTGDHFFEIMESVLGKYERIRLEKKISIRYIGSEDQQKKLAQSKSYRELFEYRILPGLFTGVVNTNIWPEAIVFNVFGKPVTAFSISNPVISVSYSQFFELLWKMGKK